jgi:hypothetical protein
MSHGFTLEGPFLIPFGFQFIFILYDSSILVSET